MFRLLTFLVLREAWMSHAEMAHFAAPASAWMSDQAPPMQEGNAVTISPDGFFLYTTSVDGTLTRFDPETGNATFSYKPPRLNASGASIVCRSGIDFYMGMANTTANISSPYLVYAIIDTIDGAEQSSRVVAVSHPAGEELWISSPLEGVAVATPKVSSSGQHVFVNHNADDFSTGVFSILLADLGGTNLYSERNTMNPYSPPGIFHNPYEGYYPGGENNTNDILIWSFSRRLDGTDVGNSSTFVFQFPMNYTGSVEGLNVQTLNDGITWKTSTAPVLVNGGYSLYFGTSRNEFRGWVGERMGDERGGFHRRPTYEQERLGRGRPSHLGPFAPPTLNRDGSMLYSGLANDEMAGLWFDLEEAWTVPVEGRNSSLKSRPVLSPDEQVVYFAESDGRLHALMATTGESLWQQPVGSSVLSDFAVAINGVYLYVATTDGNVTAWRVAEPSPPCYVCADGEIPDFPTARVNLPGLPGDSCLDVLYMGMAGMITLENCPTVQKMVQNPCGCFATPSPSLSAVPSDSPSFVPSPSPTLGATAVPTMLPTSSPSEQGPETSSATSIYGSSLLVLTVIAILLN